jgi:hypothetical protein
VAFSGSGALTTSGQAVPIIVLTSILRLGLSLPSSNEEVPKITCVSDFIQGYSPYSMELCPLELQEQKP